MYCWFSAGAKLKPIRGNRVEVPDLDELTNGSGWYGEVLCWLIICGTPADETLEVIFYCPRSDLIAYQAVLSSITESCEQTCLALSTVYHWSSNKSLFF